jgi:hypothetical protein
VINEVSESVTTTTLCYDNTMTDMGGRQALVYGELVRLVLPTLMHNHSDLYYDVLFLRANMTGQFCAFYYSFNESGTQLTESGLVHRTNHFRCAAHLHRHTLRLTVQRGGGERGTRRRVGDVVWAVLPYSEVCMHMEVAGQAWWVRVLGDMAEILRPDGTRHSLVTHGEAGLLRAGEDFVFTPPTDE